MDEYVCYKSRNMSPCKNTPSVHLGYLKLEYNHLYYPAEPLPNVVYYIHAPENHMSVNI